MARVLHPELDLHVWKRAGADDKADLYTIGVWDGDQIRSLCHNAPIERALAILRETLENAGRSAPVL